jgi:hypothetical protein
MSTAKDFELVKLSLKQSPHQQKLAFITFMEMVAAITQTHKDLSQVLADFPNIGQPKTTSDNKALFRFLSSKSDSDYREMLTMLRRVLHRKDGVKVLHFLLTFCAAPDQDEHHRTHQEFVNARINDTEYLQSFNCHFNDYFKHAHLSSIAIFDEECLDP